MWGYRILILLVYLLVISVCICQAVRLPNATYENQMISITTVIDVVGMVDDHTIMSWDLSNRYLGPGVLKSDEAVGSLVYRDSTMTNGGHLMMNKQFGFDSSDQPGGLNNLESTKLITYESIDGSHLFADEEISLSNVGN